MTRPFPSLAHLIPTLIPTLTLALTLALPVQARSPRDVMFPSDGSCYLRHYSRDHLASHPQQRVEDILIGPWAPGRDDPRYLVLKLAVSLRDRPGLFWGVAFCENTGGDLSCGLEGDAGHFTLSPEGNGALRLSVGRHGLLFEGETEMIEISGTTGDDRVFLMPAVPADSCP